MLSLLLFLLGRKLPKRMHCDCKNVLMLITSKCMTDTVFMLKLYRIMLYTKSAFFNDHTSGFVSRFLSYWYA
uniref:Putative secreted protein n=1 Tax=Amblyomma triste TaxID=251400 RepID=A0A023G2X2_AMBTT